LILVTNDDGVHAAGLAELARALSSLDEVTMVAPDREQSAVSHAVTLRQPLRLTRLSPGRYAVDGTPSDCIHLASFHILPRKPDLLVSGINSGGNLGDDVTYSGTVWAALEGRLMGIPSFAISLAGEGPRDYAPAAAFAVRAARWVREHGLPPETILNINVPDIPGLELARVKVTRQGRRRFSESVVEKTDPRGGRYFWIGGTPLAPEGGEDTDVGAVSAGFISVTPLHADMTNHPALEVVRARDFAGGGG
jgi:5'-nucleotidase